MRTITDREVLDRLVKHYGSRAATAEALGIDGEQFYFNWCARGVPRGWRYAVWLLCSNQGIRIAKDWVTASKTSAERKQVSRALQWVSNGAGNGKAQEGSKRPRIPAQRRPATRRSVSPPPQ